MKKRMRTEQKSNVKNSIRRLAFVAISVLIQLVWICLLYTSRCV